MKKYFCVLIAIPILLFGQRSAHMGGKAMERLENLKKVRMLETMKLDEETSLKLVTRYSTYREGLRSLDDERMEIVDDFEKSLASNAPDADFQRHITALLAIEKKISTHRGKFLDELREILTNRQIAEYLVFERKWVREVRDMLRDVQKERSRKD